MSTHNICFCGEIRKIFTGYPLLSRPMNIIFLHNKYILWMLISQANLMCSHNIYFGGEIIKKLVLFFEKCVLSGDI